ncbi:succinylglutamate desuccinylase [Aliagarivorans marinus]|uniref:succinylglutamate desuccinylase n=1 Tax=Aliagarivorans marinus TaxID=561965 RepID=UPI00040F4D21|nr:succinylglutamate desuccinylase [Aliagarivorans marinus]
MHSTSFDFLAHSQQGNPLPDFSVEQLSISQSAPGVVQVLPHGTEHYRRAVVISAGVHGNETAPIEWLNQFCDQIVTGQVVLTQPLLLILGNLPAIEQGCRETSVNMNRLFCGAHQDYPQSYETLRAAELEQQVAQFFARFSHLQPYHFDLHTAIRASKHEKFAVYPHGNELLVTEQLAFLQSCGIYAVLFSNKPTTTFSYHSAKKHSAFAYTLELGRVNDFGQNDLSRLQRFDGAIQQLLRQPQQPRLDFDTHRAYVYQVTEELTKLAEDFEFTFDDQLANFTEFSEGAIIAKQNGKATRIEGGARGVVFPNSQVALGHRAALLVKRVEELELKVLKAQSSSSLP